MFHAAEALLLSVDIEVSSHAPRAARPDRGTMLVAGFWINRM